MKQKLNSNSKLCCPHCGKYSSSIKSFSLRTKTTKEWERTLFSNEYAVLTGCPSCMTTQNVWRAFNDNILGTRVLMWFIYYLPAFLGTLIRTFVPGHSSSVRQRIITYNNNMAVLVNPCHYWLGLSCTPPPFALLGRIWKKSATKRAKENASLVNLAEAYCYAHKQDFQWGFNGKAIALCSKNDDRGIVVVDGEQANHIYYRDFMLIPTEYNHLENRVTSLFGEIPDAKWHMEKDSEGNIHIHLEFDYSENFENDAYSTFENFVERTNDLWLWGLKWFNVEKVKPADNTILLN